MPDATVDAMPDAISGDMGDAMPDGGVDAMTDAMPDMAPDMGPPPHPLRINELMASNDGTWVDEVGEADDWVELLNVGAAPLDLAGYRVDDGNGDGWVLPTWVLEPGEAVVLWADGTPEQGDLHLDFKLSADGEAARLWDPDGVLVEEVTFPALGPDEAWARWPDGWARCRYATPGKPNGARCGPPPPPTVDDEVFEPYAWSDPWPSPPQTLLMTELFLEADGFVEVRNRGAEAVALAGWDITIAPHRPGEPWPARDAGARLSWPQAMLAPGERVVVPVPAAAVAALAADPLFEGVVQLWPAAGDFAQDRVDFMSWPAGASLARPHDVGRHVFCAVPTPGEAGCAEPLAARAIDPDAGRLRHLRTPGDFAALAEGGVATGVASVKYIIDLEGGYAVHLLGARRWDLHYTFVRELIDGQPHLDRCDPEESAQFTAAWQAFSQINYFDVEGRRYLLGTLVHHAGAGLRTVEFAAGDAITAGQMRIAFFSAVSHAMQPTRYAIRPVTPTHLERARTLEGSVPLVGPGAPYTGLTWQPLTQTVGYGVLTYVPTDELDEAALGPQVIVVTDQVPNDIALVGGLVTEAFQTPLAHVNLLSRNRDTPNMALVDARERLDGLFGELVRLAVEADGWTVEPADPAEAAAFWESRRPDGPPLEPRLDTTRRGVTPLSAATIADLPSLGAKAAQLAELARVVSPYEGCEGPLRVPVDAMAIPVVHSLEHYAASGALDWLARRRADERFAGDPRFRATALEEVRLLIERHPVDPALLAAVEVYVDARFGDARVRFRSSSNTEDLPGFNGAGLYESISAYLDDPDEVSIEDAIRTVWASLYLARAWDERAYFNIDQDGVAMGVLVHRAFPGERANGVGISRNVLEPIRDQHYFNVQHGEALVTNPAPGVGTEQLIWDRRRQPRVRYLARSTLRDGAAVLSGDEVEAVGCALRAIHRHFRPLIDPEQEDRWFAMDIEFKLLGEGRELLIKQARPYSFGSAEVPADCREL